MANRDTKVTLALQYQQYVDGMNKAAKATRETTDDAKKLAQTREDFDRLGRGMVTVGGLVGLGLGVASAKFAEFEQAMSGVKAATGESAEGMDDLADAVVDAGSRTVYSATQAANAVTELGKAGVSTADILAGGLNASLDLAASSGMDVADAASTAATALKTFNLAGGDMGHVADLLAAGAGKAMGEVSDLSQALNQVGQVANGTGLSIDETTAALAAFASKGLLGSDAGTSFKTMLAALTPNSAKAADEMERLGINAFDASGQFVGLEKFAGNLQSSLSGLTDEQRSASLEVIFGSDAVRAASVLYEEGASGIREWTDAVDDQGYAARTAATLLDNLKGDIEAFGGAVDTALIQSGSVANDTLRGMVQLGTNAVNTFNDLPEPLQATAVGLGAVATGVGLVGGAAILGVPKIAQYRAALDAAGVSMKSMTARAVAGGVALAGLGAVVGELSADQAEARQRAEAYATTLAEGTHKVTDATRDMIKENLAAKDSFFFIELDSAYDAAEKLGISLDLVTDATMGNADALKELQTQLDAANDGSFDLGNAYATVNEAVRGQSASIEEAIRVAEQKNSVTSDGIDVTNEAGDAFKDAASDADTYATALQDLMTAMQEANGLGQDVVSTNARYQTALAGIVEEVERQKTAYVDVNGTLDGFALSLDQSTEAGSANASMLADVARAAQDAADAQYDVDLQTMSAKDATDKYAQTLADQKKAFEDSATAAGFNADEVQVLSDKVFALPDEKAIEILASTAQAATAIDEFVRTYDGKVITLKLQPDQFELNGRVYGGLRAEGRYASGGAIHGPGAIGVDSVPILAAPAEHESTAKELVLAGAPADRWVSTSAAQAGVEQ